jgi:ketosteroid isomerase-like protein
MAFDRKPFDGEAFVREFGRVWNEHDLDGIASQFTEDVIFEASFGKDPWGTRAVGKAAARRLIAEMIERVPDIRWDAMRHFVCPEIAVIESVTTGTPRGGRRFESHLVDLLTLSDGKIAAKRSYRKGSI